MEVNLTIKMQAGELVVNDEGIQATVNHEKLNGTFKVTWGEMRGAVHELRTATQSGNIPKKVLNFRAAGAQ